MLKLKYLFENFELAEMMLKNWLYDEDSLELFQYFRISSNAIYPFKYKGQVCLLRLAPASEKDAMHIRGELDFVHYLNQSGYSALEAVPARNGNVLVEAATPWGNYFATAFKRVPGMLMSDLELNDKYAELMGHKLGVLHKNSCDYKAPQGSRPSMETAFVHMEKVLVDVEAPTSVKAELKSLRESLGTLTQSPENFGLIHYDFEPDNLFFETESGQIYVIDFDDCMYHFFVQDVERALNALMSEVQAEHYAAIEEAFIEGYTSQIRLDETIWNQRALFSRFGQLYQYCRIQESLYEPVEQPPEWMVNLSERLQGRLAAFEDLITNKM